MNKLSKLLPLLSTVLGFTLIGVLSVLMAFRSENTAQRIMALSVVFIYVAWLIAEIRISVGEKEKDIARNDGKTLEMCVVVKLVLISLTLGFAGRIHIAHWVSGIVLMFLGIAFREYAISNIGKHYSHRIRGEDIRIVQDGAYGIVRHPAYLGTLIAHTGFVVGLFSPFALIGLVLWYAAVLYRTKVEDRCLMQLNEYKKYCMKVRYRLFSGIW